ncbi:hypothetical protein SDC9_153612 [bioreactor metagenome]|uniref:Uncharacterized protein n=1 Tax=bioreactor metagenome TaxID=1076179 RepID=A0A645EY58_9ZZZZ
MLQQRVPNLRPRLRVMLRFSRLFRQNRKKRNGIALGPQVQIQPVGLFVNLLDGKLPGHHLLKKAAAGVLLVFLSLHMELDQVAALNPLAFNLFADMFQHLQ